MYSLRNATAADLRCIYEMQDVPAREMFMARALPELEQFERESAEALNAGSDRYVLLESDGRPEGFIWISIPTETCEIWGKHLYTLFYATARIAFTQIEMNRLVWLVRHTNKRMLRVCSTLQIRKVGDGSVCVIGEKLKFIAVGKVNYYELTANDYHERISLMEKYAIPETTFIENRR